MNYILFDGPHRNNLLPFTFTRPVADIRVGILTIREKWESYLGYTITSLTEDYLSDKFPMVEFESNIMINASFLPNYDLAEVIKGLSENQAVFQGEEVIAFYTKDSQESVDFDSYEAQDVMSKELLTASPETNLYDVALQMSQQKVGSTLVTDPTTDYMGIFTATDALNALVEVLRGDLDQD